MRRLTWSESEGHAFSAKSLNKEENKEDCLERDMFEQSNGENSENVLTIDIGLRLSVTDGFETAIPPTALVTETAGVRIPSAIVSLKASTMSTQLL